MDRICNLDATVPDVDTPQTGHGIEKAIATAIFKPYPLALDNNQRAISLVVGQRCKWMKQILSIKRL